MSFPSCNTTTAAAAAHSKKITTRTTSALGEKVGNLHSTKAPLILSKQMNGGIGLLVREILCLLRHGLGISKHLLCYNKQIQEKRLLKLM